MHTTRCGSERWEGATPREVLGPGDQRLHCRPSLRLQLTTCPVNNQLPLSCPQATVTAVAMLPGGWLLAAGDGEGGLSCTDLRMMGGSSGEPRSHGPSLLDADSAARLCSTWLAVCIATAPLCPLMAACPFGHHVCRPPAAVERQGRPRSPALHRGCPRRKQPCSGRWAAPWEGWRRRAAGNCRG